MYTILKAHQKALKIISKSIILREKSLKGSRNIKNIFLCSTQQDSQHTLCRYLDVFRLSHRVKKNHFNYLFIFNDDYFSISMNHLDDFDDFLFNI